jgi:hypothetical protein
LADNVDITQGAGTAIAADEIGGVKFQRVKVSVGADGSAADMAPPGDSLPGASALPAGTLIWDDVLGAFRMARTARIDAETHLSIPAHAPYIYNGATFDRQRGNTEGTLLASAARTTTVSTAVQTNYNGRGAHLILDITTAGTGNLILILVGQYPPVGVTRVVASSTTITTTGRTMIELYPGIGAATSEANFRISGALPRTWWAGVNHSDASSWTYSLGYSLIV